MGISKDYTRDEKLLQISSSKSTQRLLFDFLRTHIERQDPSCERHSCQEAVKLPLWDSPITLVEEQSKIVIELKSFSDLQNAFKDIEDPCSIAKTQKLKSNGWSTTEDDLVITQDISIPPSIRVNVESSQMLNVIMDRAVKNWCCIGFKVAPISVNLIKNWQKAPRAIVYCIASISLVTFMDQQIQNNALYFRQAAMAFYEQARNKLDDILLDDMQPLIVQSYFCLSYTSNLLRLYEQQRTWGSLASISLQHLASQPNNDMILGCWLRWYYVDAWMCLTLNRECLLPDDIPWIDMKEIEHLSLDKLDSEQHYLYSFANLTYYMRRYIRALNSGAMFAQHFSKVHLTQKKYPSHYYYEITESLTQWYQKIPKYSTIDDLHFHLCYHSMRLIVLYQFLNPKFPPPQDILIDCLETNIQLLQALQYLKILGCDQSTYHHMFFAIHNTAKRIFQYQTAKNLRSYAIEQLKINLMLLKSTQAYTHDVFKMKIYAQKIQDQFHRMNIYYEQKDAPELQTLLSSQKPSILSPPNSSSSSSSIIVFRLDKKRKTTDS